MKPMNCFTFAVAMLLFSNASLAQDSVVLNFSDSAESGQVIKVQKTDSYRIFSQCFLEGEELTHCVEIDRIMVSNFKSEKKYLVTNSGEDTPEAIGSILGTIVGGGLGWLGAIATADLPSAGNGKGTVVAWVIILSSAYVGNRLGNAFFDWLDGEEFSALETSALLTVIGNKDIIGDDYFGPIDMSEMSLEAFRMRLRTATNALISRPERRIDTPWAPF